MADFSEEYFRENFNTALDEKQEASFQDYLKEQSLTRGRDLGMDLYDYDLRGAWLNKEVPAGGHGTDKYKKPNHPTFSEESVYHNAPSPLGTPFVGGKWGKGEFTPSAFMLQYTTPRDFLRGYFDRFEPGVRLRLPK
jgi:hypothetical protein